ncbi:hypothetical protein JOD64_000142 [Micromonospora luteifusca]|uniref:Uncharacterized protein n=1 Tax=Micromonospora luteifusca TaxID=709860 RepID=A0ABS2LL77_9ACTN|nr:hypothetical protein [Micromonospora luteifusca]
MPRQQALRRRQLHRRRHHYYYQPIAEVLAAYGLTLP